MKRLIMKHKKKCTKNNKSNNLIKKKTKKSISSSSTISSKYTEDQLQYDLGNYIKENYPCAILNGCLAGSCGRKLFHDMIRKHYRKGWPDVFIANARGGYHGLFIELKSKSGKLRENQIIVLKELHDEGYKIAVINDYNEGCKLIDCYFKMTNMKHVNKGMLSSDVNILNHEQKIIEID
jgi:hypothetical protein